MVTRMLDANTWNQRYLDGTTAWDKGVVAPPIARLLREGVVAAGASIAVVGAGRGHEAFEAARLGFRVTAFDYAPEATVALRATSQASGVSIDVVQGDVLRLHQTHARQFDAVLEHTCYCAIDPSERDAYVVAVSGALHPGGLLFGLFYNHGRPGGPPFDTTEADVRSRFVGFSIERLVRARDSFSSRRGEELEAVLRMTR